jgi:thiol-disulfide isomerase/thioredoxin
MKTTRFALGLALLCCAACEQHAKPSQASSTSATLNTTPSNQTPPTTPHEKTTRDDNPALIDVTAPEALEVIHAPGARATLVNVWATWCSPCIEEFPSLVQLQRNYKDKGVRFVLISFDSERQVKSVQRFLTEQKVTFPTYRRAGKDQPFIEGLSPTWSGALPLTLIFDAQGNLHTAWEREATYQEFDAALQGALTRSP